MPLTGDRDIAGVLTRIRSIAVLGFSNNPARPSHQVTRFLIEEGYEVYPVNPGLAGQQLLGRAVYADLAELPITVDMVDVFRQSHYLAGIVEQMIKLQIETLWTQLDVVDDAAASEAENSGIEVVMDRCPAIEVPRLRRLGIL